MPQPSQDAGPESLLQTAAAGPPQGGRLILQFRCKRRNAGSTPLAALADAVCIGKRTGRELGSPSAMSRAAKKTGDALDIFLQQIINGLTLGSVYAIVALGYTMVYGIIQLINFAHGEVVMIGAMVAYTVIVALVRADSGCRRCSIVLAGPARGDSRLHGGGLHARARRLPAAAPRARGWRRSSPPSACRSSCSTSR